MRRPALSAALAASALLVAAPAKAGCDVSVHGVDFHVIEIDRQNDGAGEITVTCSEGDTLIIAISMGNLPFGGGFRGLTGPGNETLTYSLFVDAARATFWGDQISLPGKSVHVEADVASTHTVYGRILRPQSPPPPGTYVDSLVVTLHF